MVWGNIITHLVFGTDDVFDGDHGTRDDYGITTLVVEMVMVIMVTTRGAILVIVYGDYRCDDSDESMLIILMVV
jgi:hypothetical protein